MLKFDTHSLAFPIINCSVTTCTPSFGYQETKCASLLLKYEYQPKKSKDYNEEINFCTLRCQLVNDQSNFKLQKAQKTVIGDLSQRSRPMYLLHSMCAWLTRARRQESLISPKLQLENRIFLSQNSTLSTHEQEPKELWKGKGD